MPTQEHRQNSGLVIIALALAGVLYLGQIFHARWGVLLPKMAAAAVTEQVKDQDVYAVTSDGDKKKYWKNGVETQPFNIDGFVCGTDFHIRGDIYRAGTEVHSNGKDMAIVKKNGYALCYLTDGKFNANAQSVFVSGGDVYAAGWEGNTKQDFAAVWKKDSLLYRMTNGSFDAGAYTLYVSGGDVYAAGYEYNPQGKSVATVWKNGKELYRLTNGSFDARAESLTVSGGDVYAAGFERNRQGKWVATVWKNGKELYRLTNGSFDANAYSAFVAGGSVYTAGCEKNPRGKLVATIWKNGGILYRLGEGHAVLAFVK